MKRISWMASPRLLALGLVSVMGCSASRELPVETSDSQTSDGQVSRDAAVDAQRDGNIVTPLDAGNDSGIPVQDGGSVTPILTPEERVDAICNVADRCDLSSLQIPGLGGIGGGGFPGLPGLPGVDGSVEDAGAADAGPANCEDTIGSNANATLTQVGNFCPSIVPFIDAYIACAASVPGCPSNNGQVVGCESQYAAIRGNLIGCLGGGFPGGFPGFPSF